MKTKSILVVAAVAWATWFGGSTAQASDGVGFGGHPLLLSFGFGYSGTLYGLGYVPVPPYFALHPPVYYGERYSRPYGASPYACGCQLQPNASYRPAPRGDFLPLTVSNPYCLASTDGQPTGGVANAEGRVVVAETGQMIENPFYQRIADVAQAPLVRLATHVDTP